MSKCTLVQKHGRAHCSFCLENPAFMAQAAKVTSCPDGLKAGMLLGNIVEKIAKPIAKALKLPCYQDGKLKPSSPCGKRKAMLNVVSAKILG